eukprot:m.6277 g.6277  ORF g.6277 m.6277 type:complete len:102 (-) comp4052_c0_seq1:48-353(-)
MSLAAKLQALREAHDMVLRASATLLAASQNGTGATDKTQLESALEKFDHCSYQLQHAVDTLATHQALGLETNKSHEALMSEAEQCVQSVSQTRDLLRQFAS